MSDVAQLLEARAILTEKVVVLAAMIVSVGEARASGWAAGVADDLGRLRAGIVALGETAAELQEADS